MSLTSSIQQLAELKQKQDLERNYTVFFKSAWSVIHEAPLMWNWHLDVVCNACQNVAVGGVKRCIICLPPRCSKSMAAGVMLTPWIWTIQPGFNTLSMCHDLRLATRDATLSRTIIASAWYQGKWPTSFKRDQNAKHNFSNSKGGVRSSFGMDMGVTGHGADLIIVDDPISAWDGMYSPSAREYVNNKFDKEISSRFTDQSTGRILIIVQRLDENDLVGFLLDKYPGIWKTIILPAEYSEEIAEKYNTYDYDPRRKEGELLHPQRLPRWFLDEQRIKGEDMYNSQYMQNPSAITQTTIPVDKLKIYTQFNGVSVINLISCDCSFNNKSDSSYVVLQAWSLIDGKYYLLDQVRGQFDFMMTVEQVKSLLITMGEKGRKADRILIENKANGPALVSYFCQLIEDAMLNIEIIAIGPYVHPIFNESKINRAQFAASLIEKGLVYVPNDELMPWVPKFLEELKRFPKSVHDDQVDAFSQALIYFLTLLEDMQNIDLQIGSGLIGYGKR